MNSEVPGRSADDPAPQFAADSLSQSQGKESNSPPKSKASQAVDAIRTGGKVAGAKLVDAARVTGEAAGKAAVLVGDLNDDGQVDAADAKIAAAKVGNASSEVAKEAGRFLKETLQHDAVKDVAAFALIGAVIAMPLPIIGPAAGAAVGAIGGLIKNIVSPRRARKKRKMRRK